MPAGNRLQNGGIVGLRLVGVIVIIRLQAGQRFAPRRPQRQVTGHRHLVGPPGMRRPIGVIDLAAIFGLDRGIVPGGADAVEGGAGVD